MTMDMPPEIIDRLFDPKRKCVGCKEADSAVIPFVSGDWHLACLSEKIRQLLVEKDEILMWTLEAVHMIEREGTPIEVVNKLFDVFRDFAYNELDNDELLLRIEMAKIRGDKGTAYMLEFEYYRRFSTSHNTMICCPACGNRFTLDNRVILKR